MGPRLIIFSEFDGWLASFWIVNLTSLFTSMAEYETNEPRSQTTLRQLVLESSIRHTQGWLKLMLVKQSDLFYSTRKYCKLQVKHWKLLVVSSINGFTFYYSKRWFLSIWSNNGTCFYLRNIFSNIQCSTIQTAMYEVDSQYSLST